ncbi:AraC family transcriptional regulator [Paenibacillus physcomitrellae]|uniref:HTH-type transcriptional activator Btr n=1 Tax=Paenibacillus physcomitrellae TaxID=1619311 RepID=A0ABQ1FV90_9BACL|nr:AraC family transcriptional regulator [Paenibacillus physcomitrellae]GGA30112.1 HTH-type transcriptional activator Btr [Paenibacillus physcomitrellae]
MGAHYKITPDHLIFRLHDISWIHDVTDWEEARLVCDTFVLFAVVKGNGRLVIDEEEIQLGPEQVYFCSPNQVYGVYEPLPRQLCMYVLRFSVYEIPASPQVSPRWIEDIAEFPLKHPLSLKDKGMLSSLFGMIAAQTASETPLGRFEAQLLFQTLIGKLLKQQEYKQAAFSGSALQAAKLHIESSFRSNLKIEQLAQIANLSPNYFVDQFKKTFGISAMDFLTSIRMKTAKQLMAKAAVHPRKMKEIAAEVGIQDEFYFSRKFKKFTGMSPSQYVKSRRRKIAVYHAPLTGYLLALQILPYAAPLHPKWTAYYYEFIRDDIAVPLSAYRNNRHWEMNLDMLEAEAPDLIVLKDEISAEEKKRLERLAPLAFVSWGTGEWRTQFRKLAEQLGEHMEAEQWLDGYQGKVELSSKRLKGSMQGGKLLILRIFGSEIRAYSNRTIAEVLYGDLQIPRAYPADKPVYDELVTLEQLHDTNPSHILLLIRQETDTLAYWSELQHTMAWQELAAVQKHQVYPLASDPWFEYSPAAHERVIDLMVELLSEDCTN